MMATVEITNANFQDEVLNSDKPVLVDFWAVWCGPCQMVSPLVEQLSDEHPEIKFGKVNTDEQPALAQQFNISAIPTIMLFKGGKPVATQVGALPKDALEKFVTQ
ncbi:MAG: thioredoxin [Coriobacteriales bacterium]